ncbi:MAG TPA: energy transducer TonB [Candidatus Acidoferrum sp.]|nr:energy transducer TonB [Candidatus Acidoferrum sp.]
MDTKLNGNWTWHRISLFDTPQYKPAGMPPKPLPLSTTVQNDVFLRALLEMPTTKQTRRSPLEWAGAVALHIAILALILIVPLYTTGTIHLSKYEAAPLVAPPPPPALPAGAPIVSPHIAHPQARFTYTVQKLTTPNSISKRVSQENTDAVSAPDLGGVVGGVPGGVVGGQIGAVVGGAFGSTGTATPPPPQPQPTKRIVRAGSTLKPPRQTYSVNPEYPTLARQTRIQGTVVVEAIIDEQGNVVQASVVSGHPLLIDAALKAVLQWKYEPTSLNGQPVSVELQVQVHFNLGN